MTRPALHPRVRDELYKLLIDQLRAERAKIKLSIGSGAHREIALATTSEHALLMLAGAFFGKAAELELSRLVEWTQNDRVPRGEDFWLTVAVARAEFAAEEAKTARLLAPKVA